MTMDKDISLAVEPVLVCAESEVPHGGAIITKAVKGKTIALARRSADDDTIVAFESRCPHYQAPLRFGRVVEGQVICPWHFFRFDTVTGDAAACDKSIMHLVTFAARVTDGDVYVDLTD